MLWYASYTNSILTQPLVSAQVATNFLGSDRLFEQFSFLCFTYLTSTYRLYAVTDITGITDFHIQEIWGKQSSRRHSRLYLMHHL